MSLLPYSISEVINVITNGIITFSKSSHPSGFYVASVKWALLLWSCLGKLWSLENVSLDLFISTNPLFTVSTTTTSPPPWFPKPCTVASWVTICSGDSSLWVFQNFPAQLPRLLSVSPVCSSFNTYLASGPRTAQDLFSLMFISLYSFWCPL